MVKVLFAGCSQSHKSSCKNFSAVVASVSLFVFLVRLFVSTRPFQLFIFPFSVQILSLLVREKSVDDDKFRSGYDDDDDDDDEPGGQQ